MAKVEGLTEEQQAGLLIAEREELFAEAQSILDAFKTLNKDNQMSYRAHYERLSIVESEFKGVQQNIRIFNVKTTDKKGKIESVQAYTSFIQIITLARSKFQAFHTPEPAKPSEDLSVIANRFQNLPRIQVPLFSGNLEEWSQFYSLFNSLVGENKLLSDVEKFQYLKSSLRADALAVISDYQLCPENYRPALTALVTRYQNKRRLGSMYLSKITQFKSNKDSSYPSLERFLNIHVNNFNALRSLEFTDLTDFLKLHLSLENLDSETRRAFENRYSGEEVPSYQSLIDFVTARSRVAELLGEDGKPASSKGTGPSPSHLSSYRSGSSLHSLESDSKLKHHEKQYTPVNIKVPGSETSHNPCCNHLSCWNCGGPHVYSNCKEARTRFCYRCGKKGEISASCPVCNPGKV